MSQKLVLDLDKIEKLYISKKKSMNEIGRIIGVSSPTIKSRLKSKDVRIRNKELKLDLVEIKRLYINQKKSMKEISKIFKVSEGSIHLRLEKMGVKRRKQIGSNHHQYMKPRKKEVREKIRKKRIGKHNSPKTEFKKGHKLFEDPEFKTKNIIAALKGLMKRPTSYEKKIAELCIEYNLPFIYTGDGRFLVNFKNPDFVNHQDKVIIEVFYSWFKIRTYGSVENYKEYCRKKYNSAGWKVIFIDETEVDVKNWKELCLNKIQDDKK